MKEGGEVLRHGLMIPQEGDVFLSRAVLEYVLIGCAGKPPQDLIALVEKLHLLAGELRGGVRHGLVRAVDVVLGHGQGLPRREQVKLL